MGTSFECNVSVSAHPVSGQLGIVIGPLDMANLNEMLDYLGSDECRECVMDAATRALMGDDFQPVPTTADTTAVHLRVPPTTACGIPLWVTNGQGQRITTVASVGFPSPQFPVTCPGCLHWIEAHQ